MAAVREVRALFASFDSEPSETVPVPAELKRAFAALPRSVRATFVRFTLEELATLAPGNSVEVRVPPLGVTQCVAGPREAPRPRSWKPHRLPGRHSFWAPVPGSRRLPPGCLTPPASAVTSLPCCHFFRCCRSFKHCLRPQVFAASVAFCRQKPLIAVHTEVFSVSFTTSRLKPGTLLKVWCMLRHTQAGVSAATRPNLAPAQTHPQSQRRKEVN